MRNRNNVVLPSSIATQLSALFARPVISKETPLVVGPKGRALKIETPGAFGVARRAKLLAAVERFNSTPTSGERA